MKSETEQPDLLRITQVFHQINRMLPEDQDVERIPRSMKVKDAIQRMISKSYSQLVVAEDEEVVGVFSFRSFSRGVARMSSEQLQDGGPGELEVDEFLERPSFVHIHNELDKVLGQLDKEDYLLVGQPAQLQGVLTPLDVLTYLYNVANPFVLLGEIELGLRALINSGAPSTALAACIQAGLGDKYRPSKLPATLDAMVFNDYILLITHEQNWPRFLPIFGGTAIRTQLRLEQIKDIRNQVFHFKKHLSIDQYQALVDHRDWVFFKAKPALAREVAGGGTHV